MGNADCTVQWELKMVNQMLMWTLSVGGGNVCIYVALPRFRRYC